MTATATTKMTTRMTTTDTNTAAPGTQGNQDDPARLLRRALRSNAIFSASSGLAFASASDSIAGFLGGLSPLVVASLGLQLLFFAGLLLWLAARPEISEKWAIAVIVADLLWVVATVVVVGADLLTAGGRSLAIGLAAIVLLLAFVQSMGVRRLRAARIRSSSSRGPGS